MRVDLSTMRGFGIGGPQIQVGDKVQDFLDKDDYLRLESKGCLSMIPSAAVKLPKINIPKLGGKVQDFLDEDDFEIYIAKFGKPDDTVGQAISHFKKANVPE